MLLSKNRVPVEPMSIDAASDYATRLLADELRSPADLQGALRRIEQRYGLSPNTIEHLRKGRAKTCDLGLFGRLRAAYLDSCARQVAKLQHQIAFEKATQSDDILTGLEAEAQALAAKIAAHKARLRGE